MKVVLAHDSFTQLGGAERVVLEMAQMFPDAPIFVLAYDRKVFAQLPESVQKRVRTSPLQWLYRVYPRFQHLLPFIPLAVWLTRIPVCDVLLSSSSAFAKGFRKPNGAKHVNYCHTPTRFLWSDSEYVVQEVPWLLRIPARLFLWWMKQWDARAASGVDVFLANSKETQTRIKKYYDRDSEVVYPFVDMEFWKFDSAKSPSDSSPREERQGEVVANGESTLAVSTTPSGSPSGGGGQKSYFLIAGRLHAHKHNDLVVEVCNELGLQLHVVGTGRDEEHLKAIAGPTVTFLGRVSDEDLREEYRHAEGYIYPQLEDFGLMPVEAAACGTPTIGIAEGGSAETIIPGVTGEWFARGNKEDLKKILRSWSKARYSVEALTAHAQRFSKEQFRKHLSESIEQNLTGKSQ
jgi:glycosyltransferase involved in cell wall biosynthesis